MRFKIDWASLIAGSKFTVFALFYFVFEGNFPSTSSRGAYIWEGRFTEGCFALPVWGVYIRRGLYMEELIFRILRYLQAGDQQRSLRKTLFAFLKLDHVITSSHLITKFLSR